MTNKGFFIEFNGMWSAHDYFSRQAIIKILDEGHKEDNLYVYKIKIIDDPCGLLQDLINQTEDD